MVGIPHAGRHVSPSALVPFALGAGLGRWLAAYGAYALSAAIQVFVVPERVAGRHRYSRPCGMVAEAGIERHPVKLWQEALLWLGILAVVVGYPILIWSVLS